LASLGLAKPIKDMGFQLEFNSWAHLVQMLTSYEQHHPEIYHGKFKRQIILIDTEDVRDSREEQEVAVAEWTRGGGGKSRVLQVSKAARTCKGFRLRRKQGRAGL
jgi:hypothetical protein